MSQSRRSPRRSPRRSSRGHRRRRSRGRSNDGGDDKTTSPRPSPGSWNVDRGRSRVRRASNPFSEESLRRRGYHSLSSSFGKVFHVEKRWKLVREMGAGAYGVVISAADEISGETVAIKLVTRVFEKVQLAKRALREITLLRHFNHENITGLIDVDAISPDFNEIYIFMEPMEADLHQIIKSGQVLTNEHVQYFVYQILRGMKYIHSASVIHRDLKPGNLLVNADCELKICDFGLSRGFNSVPDENATHLTEYVATRWYRAPEIMLAFRRYNTAIDVWSIGCILAELLMGKPLFKGKDYVDQLNKILDVLGTPEEHIIKKIGSDKAQAYVRSLPIKKTVPFQKLMPNADPQALDLLEKTLTFDPTWRITVCEALEHPWLSSYHEPDDEPECPEKFDKWKEVEKLETLEQFREALWNEIEDFRKEVRGMNLNMADMTNRTIDAAINASAQAYRTTEAPIAPSETLPPAPVPAPSQIAFPLVPEPETIPETEVHVEPPTSVGTTAVVTDNHPLVETTTTETIVERIEEPSKKLDSVIVEENQDMRQMLSPSPEVYRQITTPTDPLINYARRSSIMQPSRQGSTYNSPIPSAQNLSFIASPEAIGGQVGGSSIAFPTQGYVLPARSRTGSTAGGGEVTRRLLRTLSTVSIHESAEGLAGGLAGIAPIGKFIVEPETEADAPPSEMPRDFRVVDEEEEDEEREMTMRLAIGGGGKFHLP
ncbi:Pkinase-domain-containing protein [Macrolepiota fuliginosa MF-IS2]|uniref:mitogen-activated protein kinase n=1 Tax=Macrolepiota fuliginosa MF-IS2 TaxID=1400762 RepID=A0A9P5XMN6_9AGAR|nr:Pkinase-domain-containing protein [Macrolepiota fuliginosa MF-IS2]